MSQENDVRDIVWYDLDSGEPLGVFVTEVTYNGAFICPKCSDLATYWEGQIDQDEMGNDIQGYSWDCYECGIGTSEMEL